VAYLIGVVQASILYMDKRTADRKNMLRYRQHDRSVSSVIGLWKIEI